MKRLFDTRTRRSTTTQMQKCKKENIHNTQEFDASPLTITALYIPSHLSIYTPPFSLIYTKRSGASGGERHMCLHSFFGTTWASGVLALYMGHWEDTVVWDENIVILGLILASCMDGQMWIWMDVRGWEWFVASLSYRLKRGKTNDKIC